LQDFFRIFELYLSNIKARSAFHTAVIMVFLWLGWEAGVYQGVGKASKNQQIHIFSGLR
jgi:hypothetical protein